MSIVINGMDMPKGNSTKNLLIYSDGRVFTGHKDDVNYSAEERKTGKWIYKKDLKQFFCDQCGEPSLTYDDYYIYGMDFSNYCPNCGSYNGGEQE